MPNSNMVTAEVLGSVVIVLESYSEVRFWAWIAAVPTQTLRDFL
jgi:hypothetical protein